MILCGSCGIRMRLFGISIVPTFLMWRIITHSVGQSEWCLHTLAVPAYFFVKLSSLWCTRHWIRKPGPAHCLIHDVPENEILGALSEYGISKEILPTMMGGGVDLDVWLPTWIAQRRALEMEEIWAVAFPVPFDDRRQEITVQWQQSTVHCFYLAIL